MKASSAVKSPIPGASTLERTSSESAFTKTAREAFLSWVSEASFPCLGAKAALNSGSYVLMTYEELASPFSSTKLHRDLTAFAQSVIAQTSEYATFIATFRRPMVLQESTFEHLLWSQLQQLSDLDKGQAEWDPNVSSNPADPTFSFSIAGHAYYVLGLHGQSSRLARRFPWPTLVFNPHAQFEKLRSEGKWKRMQQTIRERDIALQGSINPMLSDFGESSEARQYSGRKVEEAWRPEFRAGPEKSGGCPFAH